jgi:polysaccharide biosynthesis transport protein
MRANSTANPDDIDITALWGAVRRNLAKLMTVAIGAGVITFGVLSTIAPRYTSEAQIAIGTKTTNPFPDGRDKLQPSDSVTQRMDPAAINTQVRALLSNDLLLKVARKLELAKLPEFNSREGDLDLFSKVLRLAGLAKIRDGETIDDTVLAAIGQRLEISSPKESRAINIRFSSADPALAAAFANRLADDYRASLVTDVVDDTSDVVKALEPKVEQLRRELIDAEAEIERTRVLIDRTTGGQQKTPLIDQRLGELTAELSRADALKSDAESKWRAAREMMQTGSAGALAEVQKSPLIQSLEQQRVRLERNISELSASLLPGHPRMQQLNADLAGLKRQIVGEIQKFAVGLEKDSRVATLRVDSIQKQINDLKTRVVSTSGDDAKLRALEATARTRRAELDRLQKQLEDNKTVVATKSVPIEAKVVAQARASATPTFPKKAPFSILAMAGSFLLGLAWVVTRELLTGARTNPGTSGGADPRRPSQPTLGGAEPALARALAPRMSPASTMATATATMPAAGAATRLTSIDKVAVRLMARAATQAGFRTMVAPENRSIDAAAEAMALVKELSKAAKQVVLVDWNLDGAGCSEAIGIPTKPGITDLLQGNASFEDVIALLPGSDVHYIACGDALVDPAVGGEADRLNLVLDALDEAYDHIVVVGTHEAASALFQAIEGRFDAGITVAEPLKRQPLTVDEPGSFLGFQVSDLDVIRFDRGATAAAVAPARTGIRATLGGGEARA